MTTPLPSRPCVALVSLLFLPTYHHALLLNIHLPLHEAPGPDQCPFSHALEKNLALRRAAVHSKDGRPGEQIDLFSLHVPHVTLYLTDFDIEKNQTTLKEGETGDDNVDNEKLKALLGALEALPKNNETKDDFRRCAIELGTGDVDGPYSMIRVQKSACLKRLSDNIVDATVNFVKQPQPIPDWIKQLPSTDKAKKMKLIKRYGSPNVKEGFEPHVTVGYDTLTPLVDRMGVMKDSGADAKNKTACGGTIEKLAMGKVGVGGTVMLKGKVWGIELEKKEAGDDAKANEPERQWWNEVVG